VLGGHELRRQVGGWTGGHGMCGVGGVGGWVGRWVCGERDAGLAE
jgi:hypothetical protein